MRGTPIFITNFNNYVLRLSFEVYKVFLGQLAQKWRLHKVRSVLKRSNLLDKRTFFRHFKLCRAAIFEPVDLRKFYIPQKKALKYGY